MSTIHTKTMEDIRNTGLAALAKALGPVDTIRFIQQFGGGHGDYTKERRTTLAGVNLREAVAEMHGLAEISAKPRTRRTSARNPTRAPVHA